MIFFLLWFFSGVMGALIARFSLFKEPMTIWQYLLFTLAGHPFLFVALCFLFVNTFPAFVAFFNRKY